MEFPTRRNSFHSAIGRRLSGHSAVLLKCSFIELATSGTANSEIAPDWSDLPGARPCAVTIELGCKRWGQVTKTSQPISRRITSIEVLWERNFSALSLDLIRPRIYLKENSPSLLMHAH